MTHPSGRRSRGLVSFLAVAWAGTLLLAAPAQAGTPPTPAGQPGPAEDHEMGSQIRKHEGQQRGLPLLDPQATVEGIDVSSHQGEVDWGSYAAQGKKFAYAKATEGTGYTNPHFAQQYDGSYAAGMVRGAYHFALPNASSGADQANYFVDHGGGWSGDGRTLPGALDVEYNPYGDTCYGMSQDAMAAWIEDFSTTYQARTGRYPVIYTSAQWWNQCAGGSFADTNPLWVARYADSVGELPSGWLTHTIWQYSSDPIDQNAFNGSESDLQELATG